MLWATHDQMCVTWRSWRQHKHEQRARENWSRLFGWFHSQRPSWSMFRASCVNLTFFSRVSGLVCVVSFESSLSSRLTLLFNSIYHLIYSWSSAHISKKVTTNRMNLSSSWSHIKQSQYFGKWHFSFLFLIHKTVLSVCWCGLLSVEHYDNFINLI